MPKKSADALRLLGLVILFLVTALGLPAQTNEKEPTYSVATTWPGIHYQVFHLERIAGNRILVAIRLHADGDAPARGTTIGIDVPIPPGATQQMIWSGMYRPRPFSIASSTMTVDATQQTFAAVAPDPAGPHYLPSQLLTTLHPNESEIMTLEFPAPPPPDPASGINPSHQAVSIMLPRAVRPLTHVILPPPIPSAASKL